MKHTLGKSLMTEALDLADLDPGALRTGYQSGGTYGSTGMICLHLDTHREFTRFVLALGMVIDQNDAGQMDSAMHLAYNYRVDQVSTGIIFYWTQLELDT